MIDLTDEFLKPSPGTIRYWPADLAHPVAGSWDITIPLEPFSADDEYEPGTFRPGGGGPEIVRTEIMLDSVVLPAEGLAALSRCSFAFPVRFEDGYVDGSIYLLAAHCPVDVTRIEFGEAVRGWIGATVHGALDFAAAGGIGIHNRDVVLETVLGFEVGRLV
ncbi:hypothetical protein [Actinomadura algeriensis]|uniref:Uncharacterized protein n=1 Tax=Actinomadura algeriensis TaxID=1679523 RepID=A0ABR9JTT0_9ACTN|nr:hypothetical protein [Actinomadura algeriensis]MBE1533981.1 hypothetical protein [Actinomadura algeriensis]